MRWSRPKSLSGLMLLGLALIAVPLLVAIVNAGLQMRSLADRGQEIVAEGVASARASQDLFAIIASLERTARLYELLKEPKLAELYATQDGSLSTTRNQLYRQLRQPAARQTLEQLGRVQGTIREILL